MSFWSDFVAQSKTASCFTVGGMKWSNALCLVFFLLTLKRWYAFWLNFGLMLIIRWIWLKWGVQKFNSLKICYGWFNSSVYYYSLVRSIWRGRKLDWLIYFLVWPKYFLKLNFVHEDVDLFQIEILLQFWIWFRRFTSRWFVVLCVSYIGYCLCCIWFIVYCLW